MVVWPGEMVDSSIHLRVRVSSALGPKLPYAPLGAMFRVEEINQGVEGIAVRSFGEVQGGAGGSDDWVARLAVYSTQRCRVEATHYHP